MKWIRVGLALGGLATTGSLAAVGCATATQAAGRPASAVHLIAYSINSDGPRFRALLTGAVGDWGPAVSVHPDGSIDPEHTSQLKLNLRHGSFRLGIAALDRRIVQAYQHWPENPSTCSGTIAVRATLPVIANSGTGAYRGITGSLRATATISEVDAHPCDGTGKFLSQVILVTAAGTVSP